MKKFLVNKENINLPIAEVLTLPDTLYELSGTHDLEGTKVAVPKGCVLKFEEGSKITNGTLVLNNTQIEGAKHCIATTVSGVMEELDSDYFDLTMDNKTAIMQSMVDTANRIQLHGRLENVFNDIKIGGKETAIIGNRATIVNTLPVTTSAITITDNNLTVISDLDFQISSGYAICKNANPTQLTYLSFIIDRCHFYSSGGTDTAIIQLLGSREGNITNCFFEGTGKTGGCIGINRTDAVNTNVIGCMFSNLSYGIKAVGVHNSLDDPSELYSIFACGLNVQSAVMLGCKYGIYIEGNDSFFLNNSMIDFCDNPLVLISQDGANITNNYFSTSDSLNDYSATITVHNNLSMGSANRNQRIIIANNTIYGHRSSNNYGIDMHVESKDCTIQGNTIGFFTEYGIHLTRGYTGNDNSWSIERFLIDNNKIYFPNTIVKVGIGSATFAGSEQIVLSNNWAYAEDSTCQLIKAGSSTHGDYTYHNNRFRPDSYTNNDNISYQTFWGMQKSTTRFKFNLQFNGTSSNLSITNPIGDANVAVYVGNNKNLIKIVSITSSQIVFNRTSTIYNETFTAVIELMNNI